MADPPAHITFSAAVVEKWLSEQPGQGPNKVTDEQFAKMSPAERIAYCRRWDQSQFSNKDGRR
jgi:hypothetical protein